MNCEAVVLSWNQAQAYNFAAEIREKYKIPCYRLTEKDHETALLNKAIDQADQDFLWFLTPDTEMKDPSLLYSLLDVMGHNEDVGIVVPNREADPGIGGWKPYEKYLQDNTAMLYRTSTGVRFDEEFYFTGWSDLDFGMEMCYRNHKCFVDPRVAVQKLPTAYGSWSRFREAYNARNRLLLEAKWYWVSREEWSGVEDFNARNPRRTLPTIFELGWWTEDMLKMFSDSVYMEHPQILLDNDEGTGNQNWTSPI